MHETIKNVLAHPLVPIVVGWGIAVEGPGNITLKSGFLIFCLVWLWYDAGRWLYQRKRPQLAYKHSLVAVMCCLSGVGAMSIMGWLLSSKLVEQEDDAFKNLSGHIYQPPDGKDAHTMFSVMSAGSFGQ